MSAVVAKGDVTAAFEAGAASVGAVSRMRNVDVTVRGVTVGVPYAFDAAGTPRFLSEAWDKASAAADRERPQRGGRYSFADLPSLVGWARRYKIDETCAYLSAPSATSNGYAVIVIDDLVAARDVGDDAVATAGTNRLLRGTLAIELHERLKAWISGQSKWTPAEEFCSFVEQAGDELLTADLLTMVQNLEVRGATSWKRSVDDKGVVRVQTEDQSGPATRIPRDFAFAVPAFKHDGAAGSFAAKLFSKVEKGQPMFQFRISDLDRTIMSAMRSIGGAVAEVIPSAQVYFGVAP